MNFGYYIISENLGNSICSSHISDNFFERKYHHSNLAPKSRLGICNIITFSSSDINFVKYTKILLKTSFYSNPTHSYKQFKPDLFYFIFYVSVFSLWSLCPGSVSGQLPRAPNLISEKYWCNVIDLPSSFSTKICCKYNSLSSTHWFRVLNPHHIDYIFLKVIFILTNEIFQCMIYINFSLLFFLYIYTYTSAPVHTYRAFEFKLQTSGYDSSIIREQKIIASNSLSFCGLGDCQG